MTKVAWCVYVQRRVYTVYVVQYVCRLLYVLRVCDVYVKRYYSSLISSCMSTVANPFRVRELTGAQ